MGMKLTGRICYILSNGFYFRSDLMLTIGSLFRLDRWKAGWYYCNCWAGEELTRLIKDSSISFKVIGFSPLLFESQETTLVNLVSLEWCRSWLLIQNKYSLLNHTDSIICSFWRLNPVFNQIEVILQIHYNSKDYKSKRHSASEYCLSIEAKLSPSTTNYSAYILLDPHKCLYIYIYIYHVLTIQ